MERSPHSGTTGAGMCSAGCREREESVDFSSLHLKMKFTFRFMTAMGVSQSILMPTETLWLPAMKAINERLQEGLDYFMKNDTWRSIYEDAREGAKETFEFNFYDTYKNDIGEELSDDEVMEKDLKQEGRP